MYIGGAEWQYCGNYELVGNLPLSIGEWKDCSSTLRDTWYDITSGIGDFEARHKLTLFYRRGKHLLKLSGARQHLIKLGFPDTATLQEFRKGQGSLQDEKDLKDKIIDFLSAPDDEPHARLVRRVFKFDHYDRGRFC